MRRALAIAIAILFPVFVCAQAQVYLGEYQFDNPRLYLIEDGGAAVEELDVIPDADWLVVGLHVDDSAGKIYWVHGSSFQGRISRANLDGTGLEVLHSGLTLPRGLAHDPGAGILYWSDQIDNRLYRANDDGTGSIETIVDTGDQLGRPTLDLDGGKVYFGNYTQGDIRRANLDGTDPEILFAGVFTPVAIALDLTAGKIYWADSNTSFVSNHIARANFDGTDLEVLYEGMPTSSGFTGIGLDLANGKLYWCDEITDVEKGLWEADLDGSNAVRIFASPMGWNAGAMTLGVAAVPDIFLLRGDADDNGTFNALTDSLYMLAHQFTGGPVPPCLEAADVDGDGVFNGLTDALYALDHGFNGGPPPPEPYPSCGGDPDPDNNIGCASACP